MTWWVNRIPILKGDVVVVNCTTLRKTVMSWHISYTANLRVDLTQFLSDVFVVRVVQR